MKMIMCISLYGEFFLDSNVIRLNSTHSQEVAYENYFLDSLNQILSVNLS